MRLELQRPRLGRQSPMRQIGAATGRAPPPMLLMAAPIETVLQLARGRRPLRLPHARRNPEHAADLARPAPSRRFLRQLDRRHGAAGYRRLLRLSASPYLTFLPFSSFVYLF